MAVLGVVGCPAAWAREQFGSAALGDRRRTGRLVRTAELVMRHPGGTLPEKLSGSWADLVGLYRLVRRPEVTHAAVLAPHRERTLAAMRAHALAGGVVLLVHDGTELDYTDRAALARGGGVGQVGNGGGRGYVCHNTLAVTPAREVLGLASQVLHARRAVPAGETPKQKREHPGRESRLWLAGCEAVGPAPAGAAGLWVDVCDRGADTFEFLAYELARGRHFVVRSSKDRNLDGEHGDHLGEYGDRVHLKLRGYARDLPDLGGRTVEVPAVPGKSPARVATVRVAAGRVTLAEPHFARGEYGGGPLDLWVVHVREVEGSAPAAAGAQPLEWLLLTDLPADTFARASERVDWYGCRPVVEEFHKGKKTGCGVELPRFESADRLEPVIALLSVVAVALLQLRQAARAADADLAPATSLVPAAYVRVLSGWRHGAPRDDLSVRDFCLALARLGGHLNRRRDGMPGWLTLWRGWTKLQLMVQGAELANTGGCV